MDLSHKKYLYRMAFFYCPNFLCCKREHVHPNNESTKIDEKEESSGS
jgi:hypothetical protein